MGGTIMSISRPGRWTSTLFSLPISQVILFNSGVGHFTRSGEVEGDARVDLTFPEQDINDLIKSMTIRDLSPNGRVAAVTYDSHDPIDRTLASFAINLNNSPSLAQILTQISIPYRAAQIQIGNSSKLGAVLVSHNRCPKISQRLIVLEVIKVIERAFDGGILRRRSEQRKAQG